MKGEKLFSLLTAAALAFAIAFGASCCIQSAFDLTLAYPNLLILVCAISALLWAGLLTVRQGGKVLLCLLALAAGFLFKDGRAILQALRLTHDLTVIYDRAYGLGILEVSDATMGMTSFDFPLGILGAVIALAVTRCTLKQRSAWLPVLLTLLPLCSCIVVTDTVPQEKWLLTVMAGLILLILSGSVRRESSLQALRLAAALALPVVIALTGLFLAFPKETYVNQIPTIQENILIAAQNLPQLMDTGVTRLTEAVQNHPSGQINLSKAEPNIPFTYSVMEVTAAQSGTLYLREQDYDQYTGFGWVSGSSRREEFSGIGSETETILIRTRTPRDILCLPYHPSAVTLTGGFAENTGNSREYTLQRQLLPADWRQTAYGDAPVPDDLAAYLTLPEQTLAAAREYLQEQRLYQGQVSPMEKADIIAALVLDSADYDLNTEKMPEDAIDFALWFLRESETGYCVHFATAAAVLLRASGVPARYVTGYLLEAKAGEAVTVTEENAHAWAEFYEPNLGLWLPLEATPAAAVLLPATQPAIPQSSQPEATEASRPTGPSSKPVPSPSEAPVSGTAAASGLKKVSPLWLLIPLAVLSLILQRKVRLALRTRRQHIGNTNQQALQHWREAERLARLLKECPPEELMALAQKAKFSQYMLTDAELECFDLFISTCLRRLRKKPSYLQPVYRFIYAAY